MPIDAPGPDGAPVIGMMAKGAQRLTDALTFESP
jgi:hypothetical protein